MDRLNQFVAKGKQKLEEVKKEYEEKKKEGSMFQRFQTLTNKENIQQQNQMNHPNDRLSNNNQKNGTSEDDKNSNQDATDEDEGSYDEDEEAEEEEDDEQNDQDEQSPQKQELNLQQQENQPKKVLKFSLQTMHEFTKEELQKVILRYDQELKKQRDQIKEFENKQEEQSKQIQQFTQEGQKSTNLQEELNVYKEQLSKLKEYVNEVTRENDKLKKEKSLSANLAKLQEISSPEISRFSDLESQEQLQKRDKDIQVLSQKLKIKTKEFEDLEKKIRSQADQFLLNTQDWAEKLEEAERTIEEQEKHLAYLKKQALQKEVQVDEERPIKNFMSDISNMYKTIQSKSLENEIPLSVHLEQHESELKEKLKLLEHELNLKDRQLQLEKEESTKQQEFLNAKLQQLQVAVNDLEKRRSVAKQEIAQLTNKIDKQKQFILQLQSH